MAGDAICSRTIKLVRDDRSTARKIPNTPHPDAGRFVGPILSGPTNIKYGIVMPGRLIEVNRSQAKNVILA